MSMTIRYELQLLAASLTVGICLMMVYDGLRLFRTLIPHGNFWTGIEDAVYWAGSSITTFLLLFGQNDGILRWYAIFGVLMGMLVYNLTVSRILLRLLKKVEKYLTIRKIKRQKNQAEAAGRGREAAPPERTETKGKERAKTSTARRKAETQGRGTERKAAALAGEGSEETDSFKRERGTGITQEQKGGRGERCGKAEE